MILQNVAKTVVINRLGQVLLLKRSATDTQRPGDWDFPGGSVDDGEDFAAAASREAMEEAGISIPVNNLRLVYTATTTYNEDEGRSVNRFLFITHVDNPEVKLSYEHDDFCWVSVQQALTDFPHPFYGKGLQYALDHDLLA